MPSIEANRINGLKGAAAIKEKFRILRQKLEKLYDLNPNFCLNCGTVLKFSRRRNKFCSHSCSASHSNHNREHSDITKQKINF